MLALKEKVFPTKCSTFPTPLFYVLPSYTCTGNMIWDDTFNNNAKTVTCGSDSNWSPASITASCDSKEMCEYRGGPNVQLYLAVFCDASDLPTKANTDQDLDSDSGFFHAEDTVAT